jgi:tRNA (guanine37-N1)-methyltransferase
VWAGVAVPDVLLSGHHVNIERWRREQRLDLTARHRPDLLQRARQNGLLSKQDERYLAERG